jgi:hypothetical protein
MASTKDSTENAQVLSQDVDDTSNQTPVKGEVVELKGAGVADFIPADSGKSFGTLIATFVVGIILTFLVGKGYLSEGQSAQYAPILQGVILGGVALVAHRFIQTRGEVKQEAIRAVANPRGVFGGALASTTIEPARLEGASPMGGGWGGMQTVLMALSSAQMVLAFMPGSAKKKAVVQKAISAALAAISEFQKNPE